jgi:beta-lactamase regulating signal transducer with metallopeptidase domain
MTLIAAVPASGNFLVELANPAARALVLAVATGVALAAFRVKTTSVRLFTWTAVLYAAVAMPLLGWLLPPLSVPAPSVLQSAMKGVSAIFAAETKQAVNATTQSASGLIAAERRQNAAHGASRGEAQENTKPQRGGRSTLARATTDVAAATHASAFDASMTSSLAQSTLAASPVPVQSSLSPLRWTTIAAAIYLAVTFLFLVRFFVGLTFTRRLVRASQPIDDPRLTQRLAARAHGLRLIPQAAESELISVPVTMGALRSTILLPSGWREWDDAKLDAVVAHEVSHVARRDALTQRLSLLHRAIFWFSPLAWWLDRQLADLAEQASDEAALTCGADRKDYARILLGFFEALHATPGRVWWQGVSMAKAAHAERQAEQRVERILSWKGSVAMRLKKSIAVVVIALAVPVVYLAASAHPAADAASLQHLHWIQQQMPPTPQTAPPTPHSAPAPQSTETPEPAPSPDAAPAAAPGMTPPPSPAITGTIHQGISGVPVPAAVAPVAPVAIYGVRAAAPIYPPKGMYAPTAALVPRAPTAPALWSQSSGSSHGHGFSYHYGYDDEQRFVIVSGKSDAMTMSGSSEDARHVEKLRKTIQGDFIWFQHDEKSYVIRDQATIDRARKLWEPQEELGRKQEELGKQQEALGKQQEALGEKMEQVKVNVPDMTATLDKLKAELKQLSTSATVDQIGHVQSEIGDLQSKIGDLQSQAGEQQSKLGEEMSALGEKQGKLGEEQGKLGEQQGALAEKATHDMKQLLDDAVTKGLAQPE